MIQGHHGMFLLAENSIIQEFILDYSYDRTITPALRLYCDRTTVIWDSLLSSNLNSSSSRTTTVPIPSYIWWKHTAAVLYDFVYTTGLTGTGTKSTIVPPVLFEDPAAESNIFENITFWQNPKKSCLFCLFCLFASIRRPPFMSERERPA